MESSISIKYMKLINLNNAVCNTTKKKKKKTTESVYHEQSNQINRQINAGKPQ